MNEGISQAHTIIIIYSKHTDDARWQTAEVDATTWYGTIHQGVTIIVLNLDDTELPPLLGPKRYASISNESEYTSALSKLCNDFTSSESDTSLVCSALKESSSNPFWRVRAEYFNDTPHSLARAFSPPDSAKLGVLEEMKPCFLEGSRGTGKTMLLLSLRARTLAARDDSDKTIDQIFGCYLRLDRGAFCNAGLRFSDSNEQDKLDTTTLAQLTDVFAQEFHLCLLESLVSEIAFCARTDTLNLKASDEMNLVRTIVDEFSDDSPTISDFDSLLRHLIRMRRRLSEFIRRRFIYNQTLDVPVTCFDIYVLRQVISVVRKQPFFHSDTQITILLDEYENLLPYQKVVVNSLIKLGPPDFSVKVARKVGSDEVSATTVGQELQEIHDYNRVSLVYSVDHNGDFQLYLKLLDDMVSKALIDCGLQAVALSSLLPSFVESELPEDRLIDEVVSLLRVDRTEFDSWSQSVQKERTQYYSKAAVYRALSRRSGPGAKKRFSGYRELAFISSGVIRFFQEILGMAYHLQQSNDGRYQSRIDPSHQTQAVHIVSGHNLATLSRNVEVYGESLKYLLIDLGDCLRQKLLHHSSEPEAARIALGDPHLLQSNSHRHLRRILNLGVKEGVFQLRDGLPGFRPKHVEDPQPTEINIARIYAPVLEISPRLRWTTRVTCVELTRLLDAGQRRRTKAEIIRRVKQDDSNGNLTLDLGGGSQ